MDPRVPFLVLIFAGFGMFFNVVVTNPAAVSKDISSDIAELFQDCNISNSITFTECLRRVKKQTHLHDIDFICLERCMAECAKERREDCTESCKHCTRRTARSITTRVINITETVDEKNNHSVSNTPVIVNVTNHIHVHNHYNTSSAQTATRPNTINVNQQYCPCYFTTWFPCYCRPQYPIYQNPYQWPRFGVEAFFVTDIS